MPWPSEERERGAVDVRRLREFGMEGENGEEIIVGRPESEGPVVNGTTATANGTTGGEGSGARAQQSGRLTDEELRRQLEAQMGMDDEDEEGVHL